MRKLYLTGLMLILIIVNLFSQDIEGEAEAKKGSYLYHGQPEIEDNSFMIEEAFNQESGVIQHIQNFYYDNLNGGDFVYSYTQEIPLDDYRHQLSFTMFYPVLSNQLDIPGLGYKYLNTSGFGDMYINYRPLLWGKNEWALVIPRFTLIVPTGSSKNGFGAGGWGGQFNLAVTKRLGKKFVSHYNAGYTYLAKADRYNLNAANQYVLSAEKNLNFYNFGGSLIYFITPKINFVTEYLLNLENDIETNGSVTKSFSNTINPGFRFAFQIDKVQIVPGISCPINLSTKSVGVFGYLSIEPDYSKLNKD